MVSTWSNKLGLFEPFHNNTRSCRHRSVTDPRNGKRVALKKMPNVFQSQTSSKRAYRELKMLCFFKHDNVSFSSLTDRDGLKIFTVWVCASSLWITEFSFFRLVQVLSALDVVHPGHIDFFQEMYPSCGIENWCLYGVTEHESIVILLSPAGLSLTSHLHCLSLWIILLPYFPKFW